MVYIDGFMPKRSAGMAAASEGDRALGRVSVMMGRIA
jgi:hypothetical protein